MLLMGAPRHSLPHQRTSTAHCKPEANGKLQVCCNLPNGRRVPYTDEDGEETGSHNLCASSYVWGSQGACVSYGRVECSTNYFLHQSNWIYCTFNFTGDHDSLNNCIYLHPPQHSLSINLDTAEKSFPPNLLFQCAERKS